MLDSLKDYSLCIASFALAIVAGVHLGDQGVSVLLANIFIYTVLLATLLALYVLVRSFAREVAGTPEGKQPVTAYMYMLMIVGVAVALIIFKVPLPPLNKADPTIGMPAAISLLLLWWMVSLPKLRHLLAPINFGRGARVSHEPAPVHSE